MVYVVAADLWPEKLKWNYFLKILANLRGNVKNHCTNTRLDGTHFNAFCMLNTNTAMEIWISI